MREPREWRQRDSDGTASNLYASCGRTKRLRGTHLVGEVVVPRAHVARAHKILRRPRGVRHEGLRRVTLLMMRCMRRTSSAPLLMMRCMSSHVSGVSDQYERASPQRGGIAARFLCRGVRRPRKSRKAAKARGGRLLRRDAVGRKRAACVPRHVVTAGAHSHSLALPKTALNRMSRIARA